MAENDDENTEQAEEGSEPEPDRGPIVGDGLLLPFTVGSEQAGDGDVAEQEE